MAFTRCLFFLWVSIFLDVLEPKKNAASSLGVGFDDHHPHPFIVGTCWCRTSLFLAKSIFCSPFTALRRCRPGVRWGSGRCSYGWGMGRKAQRPQIYGSSAVLRSKFRDARLVKLSVVQLSKVNLEPAVYLKV